MELHEDDYWAKLVRRDDGTVSAWHSVNDHCLDVAAVLYALLEQDVVRARLARSAGQVQMSMQQVARLVVLAALHDIGKFNHWFQARRSLRPEMRAGHEQEALALISHHSQAGSDFRQLLVDFGISDWAPRETIFQLLVSTFCHHGRPRSWKERTRIPIEQLWGDNESRRPLKP